jgi:hypothetical protein
MESKPDERIRVCLRIPEDFSYSAAVLGSMRHINGNVSSKTRAGNMRVVMLGENA